MAEPGDLWIFGGLFSLLSISRIFAVDTGSRNHSRDAFRFARHLSPGHRWLYSVSISALRLSDSCFLNRLLPGRGRGLFGVANHDAGIVAQTFGPCPTAGLFCNGEIGPVANRSFLHGYTAAAAILTTEQH